VAPWYGLGLAERRVGDFLRDQPDGSYVLSTKVGRLLRPVPTGTVPDYSYVDPLSFDADYDYSYDGIMRSVEFSYARLGLNRIDILYVHDLGGYTHGAAKNAVHQKQYKDAEYRIYEPRALCEIARGQYQRIVVHHPIVGRRRRAHPDAPPRGSATRTRHASDAGRIRDRGDGQAARPGSPARPALDRL